MEYFDLIVVGGGPGGSTLASFVAMKGHKVLLLERDHFPRHQIGESLLPSTVHGIGKLLGITEDLKNAGFQVKLGTSFRWGKNPGIWGFKFRDSAAIPDPLTYSYQVSRSKFDSILLENAAKNGVDVRQGHSVTGLIQENNRVTGVRFLDESGSEQTAMSVYVADASGNTTRIAKYVGERIYSNFFQNVALYAYYEGGKRLPSPDEGSTLCMAFDQGWFWYIPLSDTLTSVGAVVARDHADSAMKEPQRAMQAFIDRCPLMQDFLLSARRVVDGEYGQFRIRKDYSYCQSRFWAPGIVLVGDAACFVDPIFSSGVHLATFAALLAARSINTCLGSQLTETQCFGEFERRYRREFFNFYQFNIGFYDIQKDEDSYYWEARNILRTEESNNEAFVRLVSGVSPEDFFCARRGLGEVFDRGKQHDANVFAQFDPAKFNVVEFLQGMPLELQNIEKQAGLRPRGKEMPMLDGGLLASPDGFHWVEAASAVATS